jgi:DNA anti-recombination protein RmuC
MAIQLETLKSEKEVLKKDFETLQERIKTVEKDLGTMKSNLNAVYGAIQQIDKLIALDSDDKKMPPEKEKALNLATS